MKSISTLMSLHNADCTLMHTGSAAIFLLNLHRPREDRAPQGTRADLHDAPEYLAGAGGDYLRRAAALAIAACRKMQFSGLPRTDFSLN
jgi:hypothetical protein